MKIICRKISKYDLKKNTKDSYTFSCDILSQKINPSSLKKNRMNIDSRIIFCSTLRRAKHCIYLHNNQKLILTESLNEIPFDFKKVCSSEEYKSQGSSAVRRIFKKLFIEDELLISREIIFSEINELLNDIKNNYQSDQNVTLVSHSFRLKCIEAYINSKGKIVNSPKLIHKFIKDNEKTFDFEAGFYFII